MREPKPPPDEAARLAKLEAYAILDTLPEQTYDDIVSLAASICETPIALVSLVDGSRQWFKARYGLDAESTPRSVSFCGHVVETSQPLFVPDSRLDDRFADNPLVTGAPHVRFYAGAPLRTDDGFVLGSLCVIDHQPRELTGAQQQQLEALSRLVIQQLELRAKALEEERLRRQITEANAEVARARFLYDRFFAISVDLLCIAGFDGMFKRINPAWSTLLGYDQEDLLSTPFIELVHPDDRPATESEAAALAEGKRLTVGFSNRYRTRSGEWVWLSWAAAVDTEEEIILAVARDVTAQRLHEDEMAKARLAAEAADRAKSQFLATMSHELRTPLNSIIGFSRILRKNKHGTLGETDLNYVNRICDNGRHLLTLIDEILDISKIESGEMRYRHDECDAEAIVSAVIALQDALASERSLSLRADVPGGLRPFHGDQHRLRQVLINLVGNAIKFTEEGSITVRVVARPNTDEVAAIEVIDTGIGIAPGDLERVFLPFEQGDGRASRAYSGSGLGLAISRALCAGMGMRLELDSRPREGSTFRVIIPAFLSEGAAHQPADSGSVLLPPQNDSPPTADHRRVLVIDDDADACSLIAENLRDLGCEVKVARDGAQGLNIAGSWLPDLITLDLMMPDANGWQVLARIREDSRLKSTPVVVVSMVADESRGTLAGAVEVLPKPLDRDKLARVLAATRESPE